MCKNQKKPSNNLNLIDIKPLKENDSGKIFNGFMEILRHNVISDKPNAFNKIFNLFLCKLQDEAALPDTAAKFQWREDDNAISFLMRINELYARGVKGYLNKTITNLTEADIENLLSSKESEETRNKIREAILYKNNEFAFMDVYDKKSFEQNAQVVREIVELLQPYKIRYAHKQQFLGDFFELLLSTGFKQESGQFFTPVPLARFIVNSLPIKEIIQEKLENGEPDFLPYIIDYAMGTGHFITEAMDEIQEIINSKTLVPKDQTSQSDLSVWADDKSQFKWAEKFVYGIERDYRLVKTAKVACFLHGDGLANIIHGDGLDNFKKSEDYTGVLKGDYRDNQKFDILIANPPYSVSAFKHTLLHGKDSFELFDNLTDQSSEIECLFIERTKQLVKAGGYAAIILPSSILSNGGIYAKARDILLKYFEIYAISEFGSNTFMATGTNTVVLFMKRRKDGADAAAKNLVCQFLTNFYDVAYNGVENVFSHYAKSVYGLELSEYIELLKGENIELSIAKDYQNACKSKNLIDLITSIEREKLITFVMNISLKTVVTKSGEKKIEKEFLGYEFSNRRGNEGIRIYTDKHGNPINKLAHTHERNNENYISSYIYKNGLNKKIENGIPETLKPHLHIVSLNDLINFQHADFSKSISLNVKKKSNVRKSKYPLKKLGELVEILDSMRKPVTERDRKKGEHPYYGATGIIDYIDDYIFDDDLLLVGEDGFKFSANEQSAFLISGKAWVNNHAHVLRADKQITSNQYLVNIINQMDLSDYMTGLSVPKLNQKNLNNIPVPLPPINIQKDMVKRIEAIEEEVAKIQIIIDFKQFFTPQLRKQSKAAYKLGDKNQFLIKSGGTPSTKVNEYWNPDQIDWLTIEDLPLRNDVNIINSSVRKISEAGLAKSSATLVKPYSVIISSRATIGAIAYNTKPLATNQGFKSVEILSEELIDYRFLAYYLLSNKQEVVNLATTGTTYQEFSKTKLENFTVYMPSLETQQSIVNEIEEQRKIIEQNKEKIKALKLQKQAIMQELWMNE